MFNKHNEIGSQDANWDYQVVRYSERIACIIGTSSDTRQENTAGETKKESSVEDGHGGWDGIHLSSSKLPGMVREANRSSPIDGCCVTSMCKSIIN